MCKGLLRVLPLLQMAAVLLLALAPVRETRALGGVEMAGPASATSSLSLSQVIIAPGAEVVLDLRLSNNPGNVLGVDLTLAYTPSVVELRTVSKGSLASDWMLMSNVHPNGLVDIALAGVTPPVGDVVLVQLTFCGLGQKGQATPVAFQRAEINEVDVSGRAQDGQITIDTPPVTDLRATASDGNVILTWTHVGSDAHHYEVWRATNLPYFAPPQGELIAPNVEPATGPSFSDPNSGLGNPATNSFYLVRSVDADGRPAPTYNRVGVFNFSLQRGAGP
jgi:hypothetical protein